MDGSSPEPRRPVEPHGSREAASTAVAESEGRILDGVAIRFRRDRGMGGGAEGRRGGGAMETWRKFPEKG